MEKTIKISEEEGEKVIEIPLEESDGSLLFSTLTKYFPDAKGLRYHTEFDTIRGVKLSQGKFYPPHINWGSKVYYCVFLKEFNNADRLSNMVNEENMEHHSDLTIDENKIEKENTSKEESQELLNEEIRNEDTNISVDKVIENAIENVSVIMDVEHEDETSLEELPAQNSINFERNTELLVVDKTPLQIKKGKRFSRFHQTNKRPHKCDICGNSFTQQSHMQRHRRIHTGEKPFTCEVCNDKFSRSDKLKLHVYKCHSDTPSAPKTTSPKKIYREIELFPKREKRPKVLDDSYEWGTLPPKTKTLTMKIKKKTKVDHEEDDHPDDVDYYSVVSMAEVRMEEEEDPDENKKGFDQDENELKTDSSEETKQFRCLDCGRNFTRKNQWQRHSRTHTGERPFKCNTCDKAFTRIDALKRHTASAGHLKQKEILDVNDVTEVIVDPVDVKNDMEDSNGNVDEKTGMNYDDELEIEEEEDTDEDENEQDDEEISCDVARFAQVTFGKPDIEIDNDKKEELEKKKNKENYCNTCSQSFANRYNYSRHMKSHENVEKSFSCSFCHYMFRRQSHLTRHVLIHTGEKPFACQQCEEKFSRSDKLKLHVSRVHSSNNVK